MSDDQIRRLNQIIGAKPFNIHVEDDVVQLTFDKGGEQFFAYVADDVEVHRREEFPEDDNQLSILEEKSSARQDDL